MIIGVSRTMPARLAGCGSVLGVTCHGGQPVLCCRLMLPMSEKLLVRSWVRLSVDWSFSWLFP